jgi:hypothetical protein
LPPGLLRQRSSSGTLETLCGAARLLRATPLFGVPVDERDAVGVDVGERPGECRKATNACVSAFLMPAGVTSDCPAILMCPNAVRRISLGRCNTGSSPPGMRARIPAIRRASSNRQLAGIVRRNDVSPIEQITRADSEAMAFSKKDLEWLFWPSGTLRRASWTFGSELTTWSSIGNAFRQGCFDILPGRRLD